MESMSIIGLDLAKRVFQVHGINARQEVVVQKRLRRNEVVAWFSKIAPCLVGVEACATSHYWGRELSKLGHAVKLIPPAYVKPYVRRQKNDRADAAAICEAVSRPTMRVVAVKTVDQQAVQVLHRSRELLVRQRTQVGNALRAHLAEFGVVFPQGGAGLTLAIRAIRDTSEGAIPAFAHDTLRTPVEQIDALKQAVTRLDHQMAAWHRTTTDSQRLATIPGIGVVTASAILAAIGNGKQFRSGREFAAWIGLVPRQNSSGGKDRLGHISKQGNHYVRQLLVLGATAQIRGQRRERAPGGAWFDALLRRKPGRVAAVALANKMARVVWAVLTKGGGYRPLGGSMPEGNGMAAA
jgi:transposase